MAKRKECKWTEDGEYWFVECAQATFQIEAFTYCPFCGGKIAVVEEPEEE